MQGVPASVIKATVSNETPETYQLTFFNVSVKNRGTADGGSTTLRYFHSVDETITRSDVPFAKDSIEVLGPGESSPQYVRFRAQSDAKL